MARERTMALVVSLMIHFFGVVVWVDGNSLNLLLCVAMTFSLASATPHLLVSKSILNEHVVEGKDLTIRYSLYNIGTSTGFSVVLEDESFPPEEFVSTDGLLSIKWERLNSNTNVSHIVIMKPLTAGFFNVSWAKVTYQSSENKVLTGYSSAPGIVRVESYDVFSRKHEAHVLDWLAFAAMGAPTVLLPLFLWYHSHSKYENLKRKKA